MGQKVNPISLRLGITDKPRSRWYATKEDFGDLLVADQAIRRYIKQKYEFAGIPRIDIERTSGEARITLHCARPGVVIGRKGSEVEQLRAELEEMAGLAVRVDIKEVSRPELDAQLISQGISERLKKRASFRRTVKQAADTAMQMGAKGVKIEISGRLGGAEMRRRERVVMGMIPLHTLDAVIDYGFTTCVTMSGTIGVKVWVYRGEQDAVASRGAAHKKGGGAQPSAGGPS
ncbi:MAG: 30S ribosomal protein S3 [Planctomycetota bacterium]